MIDIFAIGSAGVIAPIKKNGFCLSWIEKWCDYRLSQTINIWTDKRIAPRFEVMIWWQSKMSKYGSIVSRFCNGNNQICVFQSLSVIHICWKMKSRIAIQVNNYTPDNMAIVWLKKHWTAHPRGVEFLTKTSLIIEPHHSSDKSVASGRKPETRLPFRQRFTSVHWLPFYI